jgi:hypothetical protein
LNVLIWANNPLFTSIAISLNRSYLYASFCCCLKLLGRIKEDEYSGSDRRL